METLEMLYNTQVGMFISWLIIGAAFIWGIVEFIRYINEIDHLE